MPRLPKPGGDAGSWGDVLNEFLSQEHNADGSLKRGAEIDAKYDKPVGGIPKADLDAAAQSSLDKADNANAYTDAKTSLLTPGPSEIVVGAADGTPITVPFWRNALASGAKADNATDDAATLQGELDAIAARGGTHLIGQTLKAGSNTTLVCAPGVTVRAKAGTRSYTLTNKDWTNGNTNIHVLGGTWDTNGTNNPTTGVYPANWPGFGMLFVQVDWTVLSSPSASRNVPTSQSTISRSTRRAMAYTSTASPWAVWSNVSTGIPATTLWRSSPRNG